MEQSGPILYIVATPIGNLGDISVRAKEVLSSVPLIFAEDTRVTRRLFQGLELKGKAQFKSLHAHSKAPQFTTAVDQIIEAGEAAYVADAGTPGISDPGERLVAASRDRGVTISPIPGPSAFVTALSGAGISTRSILFLGFLPKKKGRKTALEALPAEPHTVTFYESTHRIIKTLEELEPVLDSRPIVVAKELTKLHEQYFEGSPAEIADQIQASPKLKQGEWVIMIPPASKKRKS